MLCFLFAALIVALDQFFKQWVVRTIEIGQRGPELVPGVLGLTRWENGGAMLGILNGQQWLLAGIAFVAAVVLIMILLRYNEGFWGTLGLAAVLGGTIGNLADRIFNEGKVIDMFETLFISFPIFNIADIFITLGFVTFLIHFIALTVKGDKGEQPAGEYNIDYDEADDDYEEDGGEQEEDEFSEIESMVAERSVQEVEEQQYNPPLYATTPEAFASDVSNTLDAFSSATDSDMTMSSDYEPMTDAMSDTSYSLDDLEAELDSLGNYNVDDLLREYGFDNDDDL